jgi:hypothetical protein
MILAGQLSAIAAAGLVAVTVAAWPTAHSALAALLRAAVRLARTARTQWTRPPAPVVAHGRHAVRIPAQRRATR